MKKTENFFADYLEGKISEKDLQSFFSENPGSEQEFEELKQLFEELPEHDHVEVSQDSDDRFYAFLEQQKPVRNVRMKAWIKETFKYAAMLLAVGGAYYFGTQKQVETLVTVDKPVYVTQTIRDTIRVKDEEKPASKTSKQEPQVLKEIADIKREINQMNDVQHKMIMAMLRQESAASRLQAINYSYDLEVADEPLLTALMQTLESDPSVNVRLAALDAVGRFELNQDMRKGLVLSLAEQRDPSLQMALINKLVELREVRALPVFAGIMNNPESGELIRSQAEQGMKILSM